MAAEKNQRRVMVVDDDASIREVLREKLSSFGFKVETVDSGYEALRRTSEFKPHLFLLDITMPGMNGLELLEKLNVLNSGYEAILVTALSELSLAKRAMELGAYSYLTKPFDFDDLRTHTEKAVELATLKGERATYLLTLEEKIADRTRELKEMLEIMENREERLDAIVGSVDEGLLAVDNDENIMLMNTKAEELLGINYASTMGTALESALRKPCVRGQLFPLLRGQTVPAREGNQIAIHCEIDGVRHSLVKISQIRNRKHEIIGKIVLFVDQTEKVMADRMRNSFLSVVSHELRTPVNILTNYFSILKTGTALEKLVRESLGDMEKTGERLKQLVNNLIQVASLSGSTIDMHFIPTDIAALINEQVERFEADAGTKGITFEIDNRLAEMRSQTDPRILSIALNALIGNAVKFNREGGKVGIQMLLNKESGKEFLEISVTDEGPGIPKVEVNTLFRGFVQAEDPLTRKHGGIGTGLFLAKRAIEVLGGEILVSAERNKGSKFTLRVPIHKNSTKESL